MALLSLVERCGCGSVLVDNSVIAVVGKVMLLDDHCLDDRGVVGWVG